MSKDKIFKYSEEMAIMMVKELEKDESISVHEMANILVNISFIIIKTTFNISCCSLKVLDEAKKEIIGAIEDAYKDRYEKLKKIN